MFRSSAAHVDTSGADANQTHYFFFRGYLRVGCGMIMSGKAVWYGMIIVVGKEVW